MKSQIIERKCTYCDNPFETNNSNKKYCSSTCRTYASDERNGRLNAHQQAIKKGELKTQRKGHLDFIPAENPDLRSQLIKEFLIGEMMEYYDEEEEGNLFDDDIVIVTEAGSFIITSTSQQAIDEMKDRFDGATIFRGATKVIEETIYMDRMEVIEDLDLQLISSSEIVNQRSIERLGHAMSQFDFDTNQSAYIQQEKQIDQYIKKHKKNVKRRLITYRTIVKPELVLIEMGFTEDIF